MTLPSDPRGQLPLPRRGPRTRLGWKLSLLLGSSVLAAVFAVVGLELWLRSRYASVSEITGVAPWTTADYHGLSYHWDAYHPRYGWTNAPGYRSDERVPFGLQVNEQGLRASSDYLPRPPAGHRRVAVFGDSCTFGEEVDDDQTLPVHLERAMEAVEVLNFGVHGWGPGQMLLRLQDEAAAFHPDHVVVVLLLPWDLQRPGLSFFVHSRPVFGVQDGELEIRGIPVPMASLEPWLCRRSYAVAWAACRRLQARSIPPLEQQLQTAHALIEQMQQACDGMGATLDVALIVTDSPELRGALGRDVIDPMRVSLAGAPTSVIDLVDPIGELLASGGGARLTAPLGHWNGAGNRAIAAFLSTRLAQRHGLTIRDGPEDGEVDEQDLRR